MARLPQWLKTLILCLFALNTGLLVAHSIPEIPVRGDFSTDGQAEISIEINPRNWDATPSEAPSLEYKTFQGYTEAQKQELIRRSQEYINRSIEFTFEPLGHVQPEFTFDFVSEESKPLKAPEDAVVVRGRWRTKLPAGLTGWKVKSQPNHKVSVLFLNAVNGEPHERFAVLFPGETSFTLDLTSLTNQKPVTATEGSVPAQGGTTSRWDIFNSFLRAGYLHVLPEGLDHILFVLGLFLLSRSWKPVLTQVTAFTLAHSLTLGLAAAGLVHVPASIVEPVIALSIAAVALENIFRPRYTPWRLLIVFIFGSIHGLGFASGLAEKPIPKNGFWVALTGFNVGVEGAQLSVIALAFLLTFWLRDETKYRRWVVIPASVGISLMGLWWAVERLLNGGA
jgi:hydrogenase/urease accessory protein HupE